MIARKFTIMVGNEPIILKIKNNQVVSSKFMNKNVDFNLSSEQIAKLKEAPTKIANFQNTFGSDEDFKMKASKLFSDQLSVAIKKNDKKVLTRFAQSDLVPHDMRADFIKAISRPGGLRGILYNIVTKTSEKFNKLTNKIDNYLDKMAVRTVDKSLNKHLEKYQSAAAMATYDREMDASQINTFIKKDAVEAFKMNANLIQADFINEQIKNGRDPQEARDAYNEVVKDIQKEKELVQREKDFQDLKARNLKLETLVTSLATNNELSSSQKLELLENNQNFNELEAKSMDDMLFRTIEKPLIESQKEPMHERAKETSEIAEELANKSYPLAKDEETKELEERVEDIIPESKQESIKDESKDLDIKKLYAYSSTLSTAASLHAQTGAEIYAQYGGFDRVQDVKNSNFKNQEFLSELGEAAKSNNIEKMKSLIQNEEPYNQPVDEKAFEKATKNISQEPKPQNKLRYSQNELDQFKRETTSELRVQDPKAILDDLGIPYEQYNDSYKMNLRDEKTASAYISLRNGEWKYKDFGNGNTGDIVTVVKDYTNQDYKSALNYSLSTLGVENKLEKALTSDIKIESNKEIVKAKRQENRTQSTSVPFSKVTSVKDIGDNKKVIDYLKGRGIEKIPPGMKIINGEFSKKDGSIGKSWGVGVTTHNETGADIHFVNPNSKSKMKTMSFGAKDPSFYENSKSDGAIIFESKMDYAAAYQQDEKLHDKNVIIANGVSQKNKVAQIIKDKDIKKIDFYNQNDKPGYEFVRDTIKAAKQLGQNVIEVNTLDFDLIKEAGQDINDLLLAGEKNIAGRFQKSNEGDIQKKIDTLEKHKEFQKNVEKTKHKETEINVEKTKQNQSGISR